MRFFGKVSVSALMHTLPEIYFRLKLFHSDVLYEPCWQQDKPGRFLFISPLVSTDGTVLSAGLFSDRLKLMGVSFSTAASRE